ncbi:hypothetical protein [Dyella subtropica]|uniref:hypothetical protein n=1 Tax=Dyella subtropica TaxID=2992127 RepID=UPI0022537B31|nr:hypothetical protein [Dyella subtropica]
MAADTGCGAASHDLQLMALLHELQALTCPGEHAHISGTDPVGVASSMPLEVDGVVLSMLSTTTIFGTPVDITLAELALEAFVPADAVAAAALRRLAGTA